MLDALFEKVNDNIDEFDLLANMGYEKEVVSKEERINKVKNNDLLNNYSEQQLSVIDELLNTYQNKGITELENIRILDLKGFNKFGGLLPIINLFGGKDKYLNMISVLKNALYN